MKLTVAGTGYVGIVTGTGFANLGNDVLCYDVNIEKINTLFSGQLPLYEPGLEEIFKRNLDAGRLRFTTDSVEAVQESVAQISKDILAFSGYTLKDDILLLGLEIP